jgi:Tfp pilus assembly protein PilF
LGFTDDLIANFSKFIGLSVISQYSSYEMKDSTLPQETGKLGADYLITGSFRKFRESVRVNVQLNREKDKSVVFAKQYNDSLDDILQTQDDIIEQIVSILQKQIDYDILSFSYKKKKVDLAAYENWLMGMSYLKKGSLRNDLKARSCFEEALKIDPHYARAYSGISLSYFNEWSCQLWNRWDVNKKGAHKFALKALEYDENDYISLTVLGRTYLYTEEFEKAEHYVRKSIRMNPNDADNLIQASFTLMYLGYANESVKLYEKASMLNPLHQDDYFIYGSTFYFETGQFEKSLQLGKMVDTKNCWVDFPAYMAALYFHLSDYENMKLWWSSFLKRYKNHITRNSATIEKEALEWHKSINPYKGKTNLKEFWKYIDGSTVVALQKNENTIKHNEIAGFIQKGEVWELSYKGDTVLIKDNKGNHDIARLLAEPEKEFLCTELMETVLENANIVEAIDRKAKSDYHRRILELQAEITEAEKTNNSAEAIQLREEYENLLEHLSQSLGLSGNTRKTGSSTEKARSAVTWRIRNAINKIEKVHPLLANHLSKSIKTGTFCSYKPEYLIDWDI